MLSWMGGGASDTSSSSNIWLGYYLMDLRGQGPGASAGCHPAITRAGDPLARLGKGESRKRQGGSLEVKNETEDREGGARGRFWDGVEVLYLRENPEEDMEEEEEGPCDVGVW